MFTPTLILIASRQRTIDPTPLESYLSLHLGVWLFAVALALLLNVRVPVSYVHAAQTTVLDPSFPAHSAAVLVLALRIPPSTPGPGNRCKPPHLLPLLQHR
jgi:hypothetical protein